jgi:hypothetical protein
MVGILETKREQIAAACARHGVLRLDAFGSAVRGDFRPGDSDVDLLVEFGPMDVYARVDAYFDLLDDFRGILGTEVDLVMVDAVKNRYLAADIERTKQALYAA